MAIFLELVEKEEDKTNVLEAQNLMLVALERIIQEFSRGNKIWVRCNESYLTYMNWN